MKNGEPVTAVAGVHLPLVACFVECAPDRQATRTGIFTDHGPRRARRFPEPRGSRSVGGGDSLDTQGLGRARARRVSKSHGVGSGHHPEPARPDPTGLKGGESTRENPCKYHIW